MIVANSLLPSHPVFTICRNSSNPSIPCQKENIETINLLSEGPDNVKRGQTGDCLVFCIQEIHQVALCHIVAAMQGQGDCMRWTALHEIIPEKAKDILITRLHHDNIRLACLFRCHTHTCRFCKATPLTKPILTKDHDEPWQREKESTATTCNDYQSATVGQMIIIMPPWTPADPMPTREM